MDNGFIERVRDSRFGGLLVVLVTTAVVVAGVFGVAALRGSGASNPVNVKQVSGSVPKIGEPAPDFKAKDLAGKEVSLAALRGKPVWIVFGATWCTGCRSEAPDVEALHKEGRVHVVTVYVGETESVVRPYLDRLDLTATAVADPGKDLAKAYGVLAMPTHVLIDKDGVLRAQVMNSLSKADMDVYLLELQP